MIWWLFFTLWLVPLVIMLAMTWYAFDNISFHLLLMILWISNASVWLLIALFQPMQSGKKSSSDIMTLVQGFLHTGWLVFFMIVTVIFALFILAGQLPASILILVWSITVLAALIARPDTHDIFWGKKLMMPKDWIFWILLFISLIIGITLTTIPRYRRLTLISIGLLIVYSTSIISMRALQGKGFFSLWSSKFLVIVTLFACALTFFISYRSVQNDVLTQWSGQFVAFLLDKVKQDLGITTTISSHNERISTQETLTSGTSTMTSTPEKTEIRETTEIWQITNTSQTTTWTTSFPLSGELINTSMWILLAETEIASWDNTETEETSVPTNETEETPTNDDDTPSTNNDTTANTTTQAAQDVSFRDALKYLFDTNNIPTVSASSTIFDNISNNDPDYLLFATAYNLKLIGKNIKPDAITPCANYQVFKGLIQWRNVSWEDILWAYRDEAQKRGLINGCTRETNVTTQTL